MQKLIDQVLEWGVNKGITGPNGKGNPLKQARKMREEAQETLDAVVDAGFVTASPASCLTGAELAEAVRIREEIKDGIGDVCVTIILLAEMHCMTLEQCLQVAYDVISKRTGKMVDGTFVKDKEGA